MMRNVTRFRLILCEPNVNGPVNPSSGAHVNTCYTAEPSKDRLLGLAISYYDVLYDCTVFLFFTRVVPMYVPERFVAHSKQFGG